MRPINLLGIFKAGTVVTVFCFLQVILGADAALAGTSVDGFFADDYVKSGHFSASSQDAISPNAKTAVSESEVGVQAPVYEAAQSGGRDSAGGSQVSGMPEGGMPEAAGMAESPEFGAPWVAPTNSVIPTGPQGYRGSPQQPVSRARGSRVRGYPGRFVKSTRGVEGHRVKGDVSDPSTEWDVSSRLPAR